MDNEQAKIFLAEIAKQGGPDDYSTIPYLTRQLGTGEAVGTDATPAQVDNATLTIMADGEIRIVSGDETIIYNKWYEFPSAY